MQQDQNKEETFGTPPKQSSGGKKVMLIAAIPTVLLLLGVGLKVARVAQKAERTVSHMADRAASAVADPTTATTKAKETETTMAAKTAAVDVNMAFTLLVTMKSVSTYRLVRIWQFIAVLLKNSS